MAVRMKVAWRLLHSLSRRGQSRRRPLAVAAPMQGSSSITVDFQLEPRRDCGLRFFPRRFGQAETLQKLRRTVVREILDLLFRRRCRRGLHHFETGYRGGHDS